jgi:hypothetical protein
MLRVRSVLLVKCGMQSFTAMLHRRKVSFSSCLYHPAWSDGVEVVVVHGAQSAPSKSEELWGVFQVLNRCLNKVSVSFLLVCKGAPR